MFRLQNNHASCGACDGLSKLNFQSQHGIQIIYYNHKQNAENNKIKFGI